MNMCTLRVTWGFSYVQENLECRFWVGGKYLRMDKTSWDLTSNLTTFWYLYSDVWYLLVFFRSLFGSFVLFGTITFLWRKLRYGTFYCVFSTLALFWKLFSFYLSDSSVFVVPLWLCGTLSPWYGTVYCHVGTFRVLLVPFYCDVSSLALSFYRRNMLRYIPVLFCTCWNQFV